VNCDGSVDQGDTAAVSCLASGGTPETCCGPGDLDNDIDVDLDDYALFRGCIEGPDGVLLTDCGQADLGHDSDVDLHDFGAFQRVFTGP
jgi:hypothetical protein